MRLYLYKLRVCVCRSRRVAILATQQDNVDAHYLSLTIHLYLGITVGSMIRAMMSAPRG